MGAKKIMMRIATNLAELGYLPEPLLRFGIQKEIKDRLKTIYTEGNSRGSLQKQLVGAPIAVDQEKANEQHYEVPSSFFNLVLGKNKKYSCCYWPEAIGSLSQAEDASLEQVVSRAEIKDGMRICELGCGWGSLSIRLAKSFPNSEILALSNSNSQRQYIESQSDKLGLKNLKVLTGDVADFKPQGLFDRVVSIEMFEHVRNHQELLSRISSWMNEDARLFVHVFCHKKYTYLFESQASQSWLGHYFFTGGMMPSQDLLSSYQSGLSLLKKWDVSGVHYAKTANAWLRNLEQNKKEVVEIFKNTYGLESCIRWFNRWRLFFLACEELFAFDEGKEWFVSHYLFRKV